MVIKTCDKCGGEVKRVVKSKGGNGMRKILFRGKRIDSGEWVYGYYVPVSFGRFPCKPAIVPESDVTWVPIEVKKETVGQYTGLTDKNGRKIFEGDILIYVVDGEYDVDEKYLVVFDDDEAAFRTKFYCEGKYMCYEDIIPCENFEIIGNIYDNKNLLHDNPELLEVEK